MVARDYRWAGRRIVGEDAFFLAAGRAAAGDARVSPELLGCAWVDARLDAVGPLEPPDLAAVLSSLRSARPSPPSR